MSFVLLAPVGLTALAALVLPIAIHLVRRIERKTTPFAALRWIPERVRPRRRLRFERPWLLLLRLALLALLALLLARPILTAPAAALRNVVVVAPGSDPGAARSAVSSPGADWRWLAPGFPPIESSSPAIGVPVASLLREIDADLPPDAKLAVVVPETVAGLDGERPALSHAIDWHVVPGRMPAVPSVAPPVPQTLAVRYAPSREPSLKYLRAALGALAEDNASRITLDAKPQDVAPGDAARVLVWIGSDLPASVRAWIDAGGTAIVDDQPHANGAPVWRDAAGNVLARAEPLGRGRIVSLAAALTPATMPELLDADFPKRLLDLIEVPPVPPNEAPASALRPLERAAAAAQPALSASSKPVDPWIALAIAVLVLLERVIATREREPA
ncbi:MAG TPA: BatA domain-containing protein [Rhodanobacteraceae bacterium]|nr:BatA domain-containing protein [Rhodanobacteraceae bacterium]